MTMFQRSRFHKSQSCFHYAFTLIQFDFVNFQRSFADPEKKGFVYCIDPFYFLSDEW